jgi:hypothetical protein
MLRHILMVPLTVTLLPWEGFFPLQSVRQHEGHIVRPGFLRVNLVADNTWCYNWWLFLGLSMDNCTTYPLVSQCPRNSVRSRLGKYSCYHWLLKLYTIWRNACPSVYNQVCSVSTDHHIEGLSFEDFVGQISKADGSNQHLPGLVGTLWAMCFR